MQILILFLKNKGLTLLLTGSKVGLFIDKVSLSLDKVSDDLLGFFEIPQDFGDGGTSTQGFSFFALLIKEMGSDIFFQLLIGCCMVKSIC